MDILNKYIKNLLSVKRGKEMANLINTSESSYDFCKKTINERIEEYQGAVASIDIDPAKEKTIVFYKKQITRMNELYADMERVRGVFLKLKEKNYDQKKMFDIIKNWSEYIFSFKLCLDYLLKDKSDAIEYEKIDIEKIKMRKIKEWFNNLEK